METERQMNHDLVQKHLSFAGLRELILEEQKLKAELKDLQDRIKLDKENLARLMQDTDIEEVSLGQGATLVATKPYTYQRLKSGATKDLKETNPELFTDITVAPYLKVKYDE